MSQPSLSTLYAQRQTFAVAYAKKQITAAERDKAIAFVDQQIAAVKAQQAKSPLPADPSKPQVVATGPKNEVYVNTQYKVVENTSVVGGKETTQVGFQKINEPTVSAGPEGLNKGVLGSDPNVFGATGVGGVKPLIDTQEKAEIALAATGIVAAPLIAPIGVSASFASTGVKASTVVVGEAIGAGLAEVPNVVRATQGEEVTFKDVAKAGLEGAAAGGLLAGAGGAIIQGAGLVGEGVLPTLGRVGVNTGLGAGASATVEGVTTGKVTPENVAIGAAFGAGFGAAGELGAIAAPKVQARIAKSEVGQNVQNKLDLKYKVNQETMVSEAPNLSIVDKGIAKIAGLKPKEPALGVTQLPRIPTAPKEAYDTFKLTEVKDVPTLVVAKTRSGKVVDTFKVDAPQLVTSTRIAERVTPESIRLTPKQQQTGRVMDTFVADKNAVILGESVSPTEYYGTGKQPTKVTAKAKLKEFELKGDKLVEVIPEQPKLSFAKTEAELVSGSSDGYLDPSTMVKNRLAAFKNAGSPKELDTPKMYSEKPVKPEELSFSKVGLTLDKLKVKINAGKIKGVEIPKGNAKTDKAILEAQKYTVSDRMPQSDYLIKDPVTGKASKSRDLELIQELTKGEAAQPTGISKVISDVQTGRAVNTAKIKNPLTARGVIPAGAINLQGQNANPFEYQQTYYKRQAKQTEDTEATYYTTPGSVGRLGDLGNTASGNRFGNSPIPIMDDTTPRLTPIDVTPKIVPQLPTPEKQEDRTPRFVPPFNPTDVTPIKIPDTQRKPSQPLIPKTTQEIPPALVTDIIPKIPTAQKPRQPPPPNMFSTPPPAKLKPPGLYTPLGGGSGRSGGRSGLYGRFRKQNNPVKTANAMLKTFGINLTPPKRNTTKQRVTKRTTVIANPFLTKPKRRRR